MRKYNMSNENSNSGSYRWNNRAVPFFDIPCLYYPQYPYHWGSSQCQNDYAIFGISTTDGNDNNLELSSQVIDGRSIQLDSDNETMILQPGKLYQLSYQISANINNICTVIPVVDCVSDLCNAATVTGPADSITAQTLNGTLFLPVVETPSTLQLQIQGSPTVPDQIRGTISLIALADL